MLEPRHTRLVAFAAALMLLAPTVVRGQKIIRNPPLPRPAPARMVAEPTLPAAPHSPQPATAPQSAPAAPAATAARRTPPAAPAGLKPLNMVRNAPEELARVPDHFFWLRAGLQAAQDPVDGNIVFIADDGRIAGRATLPPGFIISRVVTDDGQIRLLDATGRLQVAITRNIDAANVKSLQALPVMGVGRQLEVTRASRGYLILREPGRDTNSLDVRSLAGGRMAQAYEISRRSSTRRYVVSEEIVATVPSIQVRVFVRRFDRDGNVTGVAYIPLDGFEVVPHDFITIDGNGRVRVLVPTASGVKIREYDFAQPPPGQRLSENQLKRMGRSIREFSVVTDVQGLVERRTFRSIATPHFTVRAATPAISREAVVKNAQGYLTADWVMTRTSYIDEDIPNRCSPDKGLLWMRPRHFTEALIGKTIGPVPYRWGGSDTPQTFKARIQWGALAGDICTCRSPALDFCLAPESAGVDCSGFVSRAWGIGKRGTAGLLDVADPVNGIDDLKAGDAFDWPGHHVRLFVGMAPGPDIGFTVLESSARIDCEGVCQRTYRPSELNGYELIRYKGITE